MTRIAQSQLKNESFYACEQWRITRLSHFLSWKIMNERRFGFANAFWLCDAVQATWILSRISRLRYQHVTGRWPEVIWPLVNLTQFCSVWTGLLAILGQDVHFYGCVLWTAAWCAWKEKKFENFFFWFKLANTCFWISKSGIMLRIFAGLMF